MKRAKLGSWTTGSGNGVDVFVSNDGLSFAWDRYPLSDADAHDYEATILPAVIARVREYFEIVGKVAVVSL